MADSAPPEKGVTGFHPLVELAWATHEALRKLDFLSDDIFVVTTGDDLVYVSLRTQGKDFNIRIGPLGDLSHEAFREQWLAFVTKLNGMQFDPSVLDQVLVQWLGTHPVRGFGFAEAIEAKGIRLPKIRVVPLIEVID
jgi:hypothetical protein